jgi:hypothetical protein
MLEGAVVGPAVLRFVHGATPASACRRYVEESCRGCLEIVSDLARGARLSPETLAQRLMLAIYGYGTNIGIRGVAAGDHGHSEDDLRYVCRRFLTAEVVRQAERETGRCTRGSCRR